MDDYVTTAEARAICKVTGDTLRRWDAQGKISTVRTDSGQRRYLKQDLYRTLAIPTPSQEKRKVCYCRVSTRKQVEDLERQRDFFRLQYPQHEIITDIGSGLNWKRPGLKALLESSMHGDLSELVVAHRDRLCRFAFELIQIIMDYNNVKLLVLDTEAGESSSNELAEDVLSIIHVYSYREMGKRRYTRKKNQVVSDSGSEETIKKLDGDC